MKASSPVRLQNALMKAASTTAAINNRSAAEQIEYWASLGQQLASEITESSQLEIIAGTAKIQVVSVEAQAIDPDDVFGNLETLRNNQSLQNLTTQAQVQYRPCPNKPGYLEQIKPDGSIVIGQFQSGEFTPTN